MAGTVVAVCTAELGAASLNRAYTVREQGAVALSFGTSGGVHAGRLSRGGVRKSSIIRNVAMQDLLPGIGGDGSVGEARDYPAGMQRYESMVVLRPDLTEDERVALTERYEEVSSHFVDFFSLYPAQLVHDSVVPCKKLTPAFHQRHARD